MSKNPMTQLPADLPTKGGSYSYPAPRKPQPKPDKAPAAPAKKED